MQLLSRYPVGRAGRRGDQPRERFSSMPQSGRLASVVCQGQSKADLGERSSRRQIAWPWFLWFTGTMQTPHLLLLKKRRADTTQPLAGGIVMETGVPILLNREPRDGQRAVEHAQSIAARQRLAKVPWKRARPAGR